MDAINNAILDVRKERKHLKVMYFVMYLAFGAISPFSMIFYKRFLSNPDGTPAIHLIGIIVASAPVVGFFANLSVGVLADKFGLGKKLITALSFLGAFFALIIGTCGTHAVDVLALEHKFLILLCVGLAYNFVTYSLNPLVDSETLQHLNKHSDSKKFGSFRIFGTYGWAIAAIIMGIVLMFIIKPVTGQNVGTASDYKIVYYFGAAAMFLLGVLGTKAHAKIEKKPKISYKHILKDSLFIRFLIFVFLEGIILTCTESYFVYFLDEHLGGFLGKSLSGIIGNRAAEPLIIGLIYCFWTTLEIPVLANSEKILKKFGRRKVFLAGMFFIMLKLFLFSLLTINTEIASLKFLLILLATLTHGLAFSLHYIAYMDYLNAYAHKDMRTSYLAAMNIAKTTLATFAGGAIGAVVIANFGSEMIMRGGGFSIIFLAIFFMLFVKNPRE